MQQDDLIVIKKRKLRRWLILLVFLLIVLIAVKIRVRDITVYGNRTYSDEEARDLIFSEPADFDTALILIRGVLKQKKTVPFISDYQIRLMGPQSCELIIYEKNPIGCIKYMSNYMYFDNEGMIIESTASHMEGVPVVEGVSFGHIVLGEKLPVDNDAIFADIMNVTQQLDIFGVDCESIGFDRLQNITLTLYDGDISVELGSNEDISVKLSAMNDMLPGIRERGLKGSLDLSGYKDSDMGGAVSFKLRD